MKIGIANDHGGYELKYEIMNKLESIGYTIVNYGSNTSDRVDYPEYAFKLCRGIISKEIDLGIVICKTGIGMSIACNKVKGVRCAKVNNPREAKLTRLDNNANVVALNEKMHVFEAKDILDIFLTTKYQEEERFQRRIDKITKYEEK